MCRCGPVPYRSVPFISPSLLLGRPWCLLFSHQSLLSGHLCDFDPYFVFFFFNDTFLPGFDIQRKPRSLGVEHLPGRGRPCVLSLALHKTASVFLRGEENEEVPAG